MYATASTLKLSMVTTIWVQVCHCSPEAAYFEWCLGSWILGLLIVRIMLGYLYQIITCNAANGFHFVVSIWHCLWSIES